MRLLATGCVWLVLASAAMAAEVDYLRDIKPLLVERCYRCHSGIKQESGLRLDSREAILKGGENGAAVTPGKSAESALLARVASTDDDQRMPPEGEPLTAEQIAKLRAWIDGGALAPQGEALPHWAFQKPIRPAVPAKATHPIDAFLAVEHEKHGLTPQPEAPKHILLRRVYLDLVGLPPTPAEVAAFEADARPDTYERVVDRLLESPQYGERWGRHFMDVWRYSDWAGYGQEVRNSQPHIWRWRDWIVESLNADRPYDEMIVAMLAADEVTPADQSELRATGFLVRSWYKFNRHKWLDQQLDHTSKAFLGVTFGCARCHDHMYDPITQEDYYRYRAFFEPHDVRTDRIPGEPDTAKSGLARVFDAKPAEPTYLFVRGNDAQPLKEKPLAPGLPQVFGGELKIEPVALPREAYYPAAAKWYQDELLATAKQKVATAEAELAKVDNDAAEHARLTAQVAAAKAELQGLEAAMAADHAKAMQPPPADAESLAQAAAKLARQARLARTEANLAAKQFELQVAQQNPPADAAKMKEHEQRIVKLTKETETAQAEVAKANEAVEKQTDPIYPPLSPVHAATSTGRRAAFAKWVASKDNPLTARVAVNHVWLRHFGQPLVGSMFDFGAHGQPPTHPELLDWLAAEFMEQKWSFKHLHRLMVTSQAYRRQTWGGSDENRQRDLDNRFVWRMNSRRMEAEVVRDSVLAVAGNLDLTRGGPDLDHNSGLTTQRRSLYYRTANEKQMTFLKLFDQASVDECYRRAESVVPQQALALANSPLTLAQSRLLARKLHAAQAEDDAFVVHTFKHILCRPPTEEEQKECAAFLAQLAAPSAEPQETYAGPAAPVAASTDPKLRARENLVLVLLNHNEFVTIR